jgi:hypothetical protein
MRYPVGQGVRLSASITDATGALVNPSTIVLTLQKPDGTQVTYNSPTNDSTGKYHQDLSSGDTTQIGHYQYAWTTTGPAGVVPGVLDVFDPFEVNVLSLQDGKQALNIPSTNTTDDAEITQMIASIESALEKATGGPIVTRTISSERSKVGQGYQTLTVRYRPLVSVTSIVDVASGVAMSLSDIDVDYLTGVIRRNLQLPFWSRGPYYLITYTAGWGTSVPAAIQTAARLILQSWWESQRGAGAGHPVMGGDETVEVYGMPAPVPARAVFLLEPYILEAYM